MSTHHTRLIQDRATRYDQFLFSGDARILTEMRAHMETLRAALEREQDDELFARGCIGYAHALETSNDMIEATRTLNRGLARARTNETTYWLKVSLARHLMFRDNHEQIGALLDGWESVEDLSPQLRGTLARYHGIYFFEGVDDIDRAKACFQASITLARTYGLSRVEYLAHNQFAHICFKRADFQGVLEHCRRALLVGESATHVNTLPLHGNLALAHMALRDYEKAIECYKRVIDRVDEVETDERVCAATNLAWALIARGDLDSATEQNIAARRLWEQSNKTYGSIDLSAQAALLGYLRGDNVRDAIETMRAQYEAVSNASDRDFMALLLSLTPGPGEHTAPPYTFNVLIGERVWEALRSRDVESARGVELNGLEARLLELIGARSRELRATSDFKQIWSGEVELDLSRRHNARRLLAKLAQTPGEEVNTWDLFEAAWPEVPIHDPAVLNRLYTAVHRLRALGLEEIISSTGEGYTLDANVRFV